MKFDTTRPSLGCMRDVFLAPSEVISDAQHVVSLVEPPLAEMRAEKSGAARYQHPLLLRVHWYLSFTRDCGAAQGSMRTRGARRSYRRSLPPPSRPACRCCADR